MSQWEREKTIFDGILAGTSAEDIYKKVNRQHYDITRKKGFTTESLFEKHMWAFYGGIVSDVQKATSKEDSDGVDYYVTFKSSLRLPVQVKSSDAAIIDFKNDSRFINNFNRKIIVINSSQNVSKSDFKKHFSAELRRIEKLDKITSE